MWPRSDRFDAAMLAENIPVVVAADLYTAGLSALVAPGLQVTGGSITVDRTAATRRSATVAITDDDAGLITALTGTSRLDPGPLEMLISRGVQYPDGSQELIPQGVFRVSEADVTDIAGPQVQLTVYDRSRTVARAKLLNTYVIPAGTAYLTAAPALVDDRLAFPVPVLRSVESSQTAATTPAVIAYQEQDDPWQRVIELCAAVGCETFFDVDGSHRIRDIPDPTVDLTAFEFVDDETSLLLSVGHNLSDEPGYNACVVTGQTSANTTSVPRAVAVDNDPSSPTYFYGPYGQVPEFYNDPTASTSAQCQTIATARLRSILGWTETLSLAVVPHPALDASDVIRVARGPSAVDTTIVIEAMTVPLDVTTAMTITGRVRRAA